MIKDLQGETVITISKQEDIVTDVVLLPKFIYMYLFCRAIAQRNLSIHDVLDLIAVIMEVELLMNFIKMQRLLMEDGF